MGALHYTKRRLPAAHGLSGAAEWRLGRVESGGECVAPSIAPPQHEAPLPLLSRRLISDRARLIFSFVLEHLAESGIDAEVHASGGYEGEVVVQKVGS